MRRGVRYSSFSNWTQDWAALNMNDLSVSRGGLLPASTAMPLFCHSLSSWKYPLQGMVLQTNLYSYHFNKNVKSIYIHLRWVQLGGQTLNSWFVSFIWLVAKLCLTLRDAIHEPQPTRLLCLWDSPSKNTGVGKHSLLQGILLTQGLNPLHWQGSSLSLSYLRNPNPGTLLYDVTKVLLTLSWGSISYITIAATLIIEASICWACIMYVPYNLRKLTQRKVK